MRTTPKFSWLIEGPYPTGNYAGLYYLDFGEYPQTSIEETLPNPEQTTQNPTTLFYEDSVTGLKYELKSGNYYLVEPVRWLVIGNGSGLNEMGYPNKNYDNLDNNSLLLISEKSLINSRYDSSQTAIAWENSEIYRTTLPNLKNKIFNTFELQNLGDIYEGGNAYSQLSMLCYDDSISFKHSNYCTSSQFISFNTDYSLSTNLPDYWLKISVVQNGSYSHYRYGGGSGWGAGYGHTMGYDTGVIYRTDIRHSFINIRPIIILNV